MCAMALKVAKTRPKGIPDPAQRFPGPGPDPPHSPPISCVLCVWRLLTLDEQVFKVVVLGGESGHLSLQLLHPHPEHGQLLRLGRTQAVRLHLQRLHRHNNTQRPQRVSSTKDTAKVNACRLSSLQFHNGMKNYSRGRFRVFSTPSPPIKVFICKVNIAKYFLITYRYISVCCLAL